jgi:hypothetical protein
MKRERYVIEVHVANATSTNNKASEYNKENRSQIQKIKFDSDSFPIGVDIFSSYCMTNDFNHFESYTPNNSRSKGRIKVADSSKIEIHGKGTVV